MPKYPQITINLSKNASNFEIVMACLMALKSNNLGNELENFIQDIENGGASNLLATAAKWFNLKLTP